MSGLAVLFHRDGRPIDPSAIVDMLTAVPYRGPDGMWTQIFGAIALGYAKLAVTPEQEMEQQPLVSPRTGCVLIADVRLDNRDELLARLPDQPIPMVSDAEIILRAYEEWGVDAITHLLGDFAFAIWDPRHQHLMCGRDTNGQRTLYYRVDRHTFAAASEIHQLFQDPSVPIAPNHERIRDFLVPLSMHRNEQDKAATFYQGIFSLPAGHVMVVDRETIRAWKYWELSPPAELRYRTDDEYAEHFRSLFFDVVRARLRSSYPIGSMLSGGLDSSSVVCTALELFRSGAIHNPGFINLSLVFDGLECDERRLIQEIQAKYDCECRYVSPGEFARRLDLEPPGFQASPHATFSEVDALYGAAAEAGVRVLVTGDMADGCIKGSWLVFDSLLRSGNLRDFGRYLRAYRRISDESLQKILALYCFVPLLPLSLQRWLSSAYIRRSFQRDYRRLAPSWIPEPLRLDLVERHLHMSLELVQARRFLSPARDAEYQLLYPPEVGRLPKGRPMEIRRPFADRRLHEFLLAIPPEQKFEPHPETDEFYAGAKRLVRRAMRGILPESIRTRKSKTQFASVFENELERRWSVYEEAFGPGAHPEVSRLGYVDQALFWSRLKQLRNGRRGADFRYVMRVVRLETWLRTFKLPRAQFIKVPSLASDHYTVVERSGAMASSIGRASIST